MGSNELGAIGISFAGRRAAILLTARPEDVAALLRALADEETAARRAALDRTALAVRHSSDCPKGTTLG